MLGLVSPSTWPREVSISSARDVGGETRVATGAVAVGSVSTLVATGWSVVSSGGDAYEPFVKASFLAS